MDSGALDQLAGLLRRATALMEGAGQAGWLLRMAAEEHAHEEFVGLHNGILEILQVSQGFDLTMSTFWARILPVNSISGPTVRTFCLEGCYEGNTCNALLPSSCPVRLCS